tara:strand:+ start:2627 stop:3856 length:1230 start_codon:yes stop_codon:yes gene_type:complete
VSKITKYHTKLAISFPEEVNIIFKIFNSQIRLVGGAVRNMLLKKTVKDYDFATIYKPTEIINILRQNNIKFIDLAQKFGTIIAVINNKNFEITTLRQDFSHDGRHCKVNFSNDYIQDASRRDFTINALYLDQNGVLYDYFSSLKDLKTQNIQFIGNSDQRISEDYLRILRFFRFSAIYGKNINQQNLKSCIKFQNHLNNLSKSRIREEFIKIITADKINNIIAILTILQKHNFTNILFNCPVNINNIKKLHNLTNKINYQINKELILACFFINNNFNLKQLQFNLNLTKLETKYLNFFYKNLNTPLINKKDIAILASNNSEIKFLLDFYIFRQIIDVNEIAIDHLKEMLDFLNKSMVAILPINGNDITNLGFKNNEVGQILKQCKLTWLMSDFKLDYQELLSHISHKKK